MFVKVFCIFFYDFFFFFCIPLIYLHLKFSFLSYLYPRAITTCIEDPLIYALNLYLVTEIWYITKLMVMSFDGINLSVKCPLNIWVLSVYTMIHVRVVMSCASWFWWDCWENLIFVLVYCAMKCLSSWLWLLGFGVGGFVRWLCT